MDRLNDAVDKIVNDLTGRKGLRQEWDNIDEEIQNEIKEQWVEILKESLQKPAPVGGDDPVNQPGYEGPHIDYSPVEFIKNPNTTYRFEPLKPVTHEPVTQAVDLAKFILREEWPDFTRDLDILAAYFKDREELELKRILRIRNFIVLIKTEAANLLTAKEGD